MEEPCRGMSLAKTQFLCYLSKADRLYSCPDHPVMVVLPPPPTEAAVLLSIPATSDSRGPNYKLASINKTITCAPTGGAGTTEKALSFHSRRARVLAQLHARVLFSLLLLQALISRSLNLSRRWAASPSWGKSNVAVHPSLAVRLQCAITDIVSPCL